MQERVKMLEDDDDKLITRNAKLRPDFDNIADRVESTISEAKLREEIRKICETVGTNNKALENDPKLGKFGKDAHN